MEAYDSDQDPKSNHGLKLEHKVESSQNTDSEELQGVVPDTPHKKLARRLQKPKKKIQGTKGHKDQFKAITRILGAIQEQAALINQKCESQAISTEHLTQQIEDVNQELLIQRERTQCLEDDFYQKQDREEPPESEEKTDPDDQQTIESDDGEWSDRKRCSYDKQKHPGSQKIERKTSGAPTKDAQPRKVAEFTPLLAQPQLTAETMAALIKETVAGELRTMRRRMDQMDKENLPYIPDLGSEELPLPYTEAIMSGKTSKNIKFQKIDLYDGSTDPYDHLDNFRSTMDSKDPTEADKCKAFSQTLKGSAFDWFRRIPAGTI